MAGCQPCANSSFVNDCEGCTVLGCQVRCDSCLFPNRTGGLPQTLTIPAGGCNVFNEKSELICTPGTEGFCPLGEHSIYSRLIAGTAVSSRICSGSTPVSQPQDAKVWSLECLDSDYFSSRCGCAGRAASMHDCRCSTAAEVTVLDAHCTEQQRDNVFSALQYQCRPGPCGLHPGK